ncbi:putative dna-binding protein [Botrytis fragariae]|uniref:Putative dna-binding protein n=1 Tax=Botrytis fragariae TaxID=1964551 RepID=A0A8H6ANZ8_9HELO|nr:putative dna-binding protein [Botrytis fragariae]KAF5871012.1 putative dna-binding protein [Botrytis fragariae]
MDPNDSDPFEGPFDIPEPDSGSAYENSDSDFGQISHDERARTGVSHNHGSNDGGDIYSEGERDSYSTSLANPNPNNQYTDEWIIADALKWAATFVPPKVEDIPLPTRGAYRPTSKKRKLKQRTNGNPARAKRVKGFYSKDYRHLLNNEIYDVGAKSILEDNTPLEGSQIGCSIWSPEEKDLFFTGLSRLGRDNVRAIATRIGTKSEVEVQEYMQLLHQGLKERKTEDARLLDVTEYPAAAEFTSECCEIMERAADGLALRQEQYEEDVEEVKWGKYWLLTEKVSKSLEQKRSVTRTQGNEDIQDLLPAVRLLNLKNWLALSERVFMNPSESRCEDNWKQIGEHGETPAMRATAFDDFHSLTVSITKRLVSTVLFCTMSRIRAMDSNKTKAADISINDVEAATKILKMDANSNEFWVKCARRNNLSISRHDEPGGPIMTYSEVETELRKEYSGRRSRSRSRSRPHLDHAEELSEVYTSSSNSHLDSDIESDASETSIISNHLDDNPFTQRSPSPSQSQTQSRSQRKPHLSPEEYEHALEAYISAFDDRVSRIEEQRIWSLLGQDPPPDLKADEDEEMPEKPARKLEVEAESNGEEWREREFQSEWEVMGVVGEEEFLRNREKIGRRERRERLKESREGEAMAMRIKMAENQEYSGESGSEWDDVDGETVDGVDKENARGSYTRHDETIKPKDIAKPRSYVVYNSDDD